MKFALCLFGRVGNIIGKSSEYSSGTEQVLKLCHKHWKKYIIRPNDIDVFIHSWDTEIENKAIKLFQPKKAVFEEQIKFDIPDYVVGTNLRTQAHYSRWYSSKKSIDLKSEFEKENKITYDMVMIGRFDIAWKKKIIFSDLNHNKFYIGGWFRKHPIKVKDFWFIANSGNMNKFSLLYDNLDNYLLPGNCSMKTKVGISNHKLAKYHIDKEKFDIDYLLKCDDNYNPDLSDYPLIRHYYFGAKE